MSTTSIEGPAPLQAGNIPSYANERDPCWEDVIKLVVIPGQPGAIHEAAGVWELLFSRIDQVRSTLDQLSSGLAGWQGAAGEAYRGHLTELSHRLTQLLDAHRPLVQQLNSAADHLNHALHNTPIPEELVDEAMAARDKFHTTGVLDTQFHSGFFFDSLFPSYLDWVGDLLGILTFGLSDKASDMLRDFLSDGDDQAKAAYQALAGQHVNTVNSLNQFPTLLAPGVSAQTLDPPMPTSPTYVPVSGPGTGTMPPTGAPTYDPGHYGPGTSLAGAGGLGGLTAVGGPSGGPSGLGPIDPGGLGSSGSGPGGSTGGLGAAGGIGLGGARPGVGGAGVAGVGAAGGAAAAARGRTTSAASAIAGKSGSMPMMGGGMAGAGGGGARGAAGRSAVRGVAPSVAGGAAMGRTGMPMAGAHGGEDGDANDHSTWLQEDEDVWGTDSDAAPPVVG